MNDFNALRLACLHDRPLLAEPGRSGSIAGCQGENLAAASSGWIRPKADTGLIMVKLNSAIYVSLSWPKFSSPRFSYLGNRKHLYPDADSNCLLFQIPAEISAFPSKSLRLDYFLAYLYL